MKINWNPHIIMTRNIICVTLMKEGACRHNQTIEKGAQMLRHSWQPFSRGISPIKIKSSNIIPNTLSYCKNMNQLISFAIILLLQQLLAIFDRTTTVSGMIWLKKYFIGGPPKESSWHLLSMFSFPVFVNSSGKWIWHRWRLSRFVMSPGQVPGGATGTFGAASSILHQQIRSRHWKCHAEYCNFARRSAAQVTAWIRLQTGFVQVCLGAVAACRSARVPRADSLDRRTFAVESVWSAVA